MSDTARITRAREEVASARVKLLRSSAELKGRVEPAHLADDAVRRVRERGRSVMAKAQDVAREHPYSAAGLGVAAALLIFGGPVARLVRKPSAKAYSAPKQHALPRPHGDKK